jgi:DNA-binding protein HU-beta
VKPVIPQDENARLTQQNLAHLRRHDYISVDPPIFCDPHTILRGKTRRGGLPAGNETVSDSLEMMPLRCHKQRLDMTKTQLQVALAAATETNKRTAGVFLETLSALAYKEIKKNGEFVLPGFGKLVKQKRKARTGFNPKTQQKIKIPAKTVVKFRVAKAAKDAVLGVKK